VTHNPLVAGSSPARPTNHCLPLPQVLQKGERQGISTVINRSVCRTVPSAKASFSTVLLSSNLSEQRILCRFERNENAVLNVSSKSGNAMPHFLIFSFSPALRFSSSRYGLKKCGFSMCQYRINFLRFVSMRYVVCSVLRRMRETG
jgi:hypothetical protein